MTTIFLVGLVVLVAYVIHWIRSGGLALERPPLFDLPESGPIPDAREKFKTFLYLRGIDDPPEAIFNGDVRARRMALRDFLDRLTAEAPPRLVACLTPEERESVFQELERKFLGSGPERGSS